MTTPSKPARSRPEDDDPIESSDKTVFVDVPTELGPYRLTKILGRGGMGEVWQALDTHLERDVALKLMRKELLSNEEAVKRFFREARAVARLNHPNIVQVYAFGDQAKVMYFVMELVEGETVTQLIKREGPLKLPAATRVIMQSVEGLSYACARGIVHRDIKPSNLMITPEGRIKIADFGLARITESQDSAITAAGSTMGSPNYMSPEQARGEEADHRSDIYSLGISFYQVLAGSLPFTAQTPLSVLLKQIQEPLPEPDLLRGMADGRALGVIKKMTEKDAGKRHQTYAELAQDLAALMPDGFGGGSGIAGGGAFGIGGATPSAHSPTSSIPVPAKGAEEAGQPDSIAPWSSIDEIPGKASSGDGITRVGDPRDLPSGVSGPGSAASGSGQQGSSGAGGGATDAVIGAASKVTSSAIEVGDLAPVGGGTSRSLPATVTSTAVRPTDGSAAGEVVAGGRRPKVMLVAIGLLALAAVACLLFFVLSPDEARQGSVAASTSGNHGSAAASSSPTVPAPATTVGSVETPRAAAPDGPPRGPAPEVTKVAAPSVAPGPAPRVQQGAQGPGFQSVTVVPPMSVPSPVGVSGMSPFPPAGMPNPLDAPMATPTLSPTPPPVTVNYAIIGPEAGIGEAVTAYDESGQPSFKIPPKARAEYLEASSFGGRSMFRVRFNGRAGLVRVDDVRLHYSNEPEQAEPASAAEPSGGGGTTVVLKTRSGTGDIQVYLDEDMRIPAAKLPQGTRLTLLERTAKMFKARLPLPDGRPVFALKGLAEEKP